MITETATTIGYRKSLVTCSDKPREAIIKANNNLTESNENDDWEMMGKDLKRLQELIKSLETMNEEQSKKDEKQTNTTNTTNTLENTTK